MVGVPIVLVSAKTVQVTLPLLLVASAVGAIARGRTADLKPPLGATTAILFLLLAYAALSALWAPHPLAAIGSAAMAAFVTAGALVLAQIMRTEPPEDALHIIEGLWVGLLVGMLYASIEVASDQAIKIWVYNALGLGPNDIEPARFFTWSGGKLIAIHRDDITRNVFPIPLLLWPAIMGAAVIAEGELKRSVYAALIIVGSIAILIGTSASGKVAFVLGVLAFVLARYSGRLAQVILSACWTAACLCVVPAVLLARALDLQNAAWLHLSARIRVTIWNEIALQTLKSPLFGIGADMAYTVRPPLREIPPSAPPEILGIPIPHPHNAYLQVWYELGFVGALLLALFGLYLLRQIRDLGAASAYGFAFFATAATAVAFSYSIWQIWLICLYGLAFALFMLGENIVQRNANIASQR